MTHNSDASGLVEMHPGDLLNLGMLKEVIEKPFLGSLWVEGDSGMLTPHVCEAVFGDGLQLLTISTCNQRPNYWVVRVDSSWKQSNWHLGPEDTIGEHIDEILGAIEEECGTVGEWLDEECKDCGDEHCRCNTDSLADFPAVDSENGVSWGRIALSEIAAASIRARASQESNNGE